MLFLGQKPFGEAAWTRLREAAGGGLAIVGVMTNTRPDQGWWGTCGVMASRGDVPVIDNAKRNTEALLALIAENRPDTILSVQHPWILPPEVPAAVGYRAINFHNARLPDYRGHNAVNHALLAGDTEFTCTAHWMVDEVDSGDIAFECSFSIAADETALSLYGKAVQAGLRVFDAVLRCLLEGQPIPRRPARPGGRLFPRHSTASLRRIEDPGLPEMDTKARAFFFPPFEPAYVEQHGRRVYVLPSVAWPGLGAADGRRWVEESIRRGAVGTGFGLH